MNEFRIYKLDNNKLYNYDENWNKLDFWTEEILLKNINDNLWNEFKKIEWIINFKDLKEWSWFKIYTFSWIKIDTEHEWPNWLNFLNLVWEDDKKIDISKEYINVKLWILSVFKINWSFYIITYWNWFHSIPTYIIDEEFWINLTKKFITKNWQVKSINQSVIKWDLESTYKSLKTASKYNPMEDITNLWKKTKWLKWVWNSIAIFEDIKELQSLHLSLEWNKWIKINIWNVVWIDQDLFIKILKKVNYFDNRDDLVDTYSLPDLDKIKSDSQIYITLKNKIIHNLTENNDVYFSPDLFNSYIFQWESWYSIFSFTVNEGENKFNFNQNDNWIFENLDLLKYLKNSWFNFNNLDYIRFSKIKYIKNWEIEDINKKPKLLYFLQWEVQEWDDTYLFEWENIYKPNDDFKWLVINDFDNKITNLFMQSWFLHNWSITNSITEWRYNEEKFNRAHDKNIESSYWIDGFYCFDKWVNMTYWFDWIEICDLIKSDSDNLYFIHVKESHWANLRVLFSQWRVWTDKILLDPANTVKHIRDNSSLTITSTKIKNKNFNIVYAIKNPKTTDIFTLYAKFDFISTLEHFYQKWINIKLYLIN